MLIRHFSAEIMSKSLFSIKAASKTSTSTVGIVPRCHVAFKLSEESSPIYLFISIIPIYQYIFIHVGLQQHLVLAKRRRPFCLADWFPSDSPTSQTGLCGWTAVELTFGVFPWTAIEALIGFLVVYLDVKWLVGLPPAQVSHQWQLVGL